MTKDDSNPKHFCFFVLFFYRNFDMTKDDSNPKHFCFANL